MSDKTTLRKAPTLPKAVKKLRDHALLRDLLSSLLFFALLLLLDYGLRSIHEGTGITPSDSEISKNFTLPWAILLTFLTRMLPGRIRKVGLGLTGGLYILLFLVNAMMMRAKGSFFSFSAMIFAGDGFKFLEASYLQVRKMVWIIFFFTLFLLVLSILLSPAGKTRGWWLAIAVIPLCVTSIHQNKQENLTDRLQIHFDIHQASLLYEDFTNPNECLMLTGLYQYTFRDFCLTYGVYNKLNRISGAETVETLDGWYASKEADPDNEWTGRYAGKNLLLIQLEAIDTWMLNEQFMPNLYRIQQQSLDFTHHYTPMYLDAGTFNTEMIVNTGLVSPFVGSTSSMYSRNAYPDSLAHLMTAADYTARSFHRSGGDVYNRAEIHENWGYQHYYSGAEMGFEEMDFDTELMRGYDTFTEGQPFLSFLITYSGHGPYADSSISARYYDFAAAQLPAGTAEMAIHAYAHAWATDLFIGELFEQLEADGRLEDTVVVFYSDHYNYYTLDDTLVMQQKGVDDKNMITRTPFFICEKHTEAQKIEKVTSTVDILPTLVNLFGLESDGTHYVGNDAFSENGGYAIFADYSWYDGETYWNALGSQPPTAEISARNEELRRRLSMSWDTMRMDYFAD